MSEQSQKLHSSYGHCFCIVFVCLVSIYGFGKWIEVMHAPTPVVEEGSGELLQ